MKNKIKLIKKSLLEDTQRLKENDKKSRILFKMVYLNQGIPYYHLSHIYQIQFNVSYLLSSKKEIDGNSNHNSLNSRNSKIDFAEGDNI